MRVGRQHRDGHDGAHEEAVVDVPVGIAAPARCERDDERDDNEERRHFKSESLPAG